MLMVRTTVETQWHEPGEGFFTIPAGATGHPLTKEIHGKIRDSLLYAAIRRQYRKRGIKGVFFSWEGKYRWLHRGQFELIEE